MKYANFINLKKLTNIYFQNTNTLKTDLVKCRSMFGTNYISLREVTRLGLRNDQNKLFTENTYLKK